MFISNNANPFLISPYAPNQVNGRQATLVTLANTIKPYTPSSTIQVLGNMNVNGYSLSINNSPLFTYQITSLPGLGLGVVAACDAATNSMIVNVGPTPVLRAALDGIHTPGLELSPTTIIPAVASSAGYTPITVNGTQYWIQIFN